MKFFIKILIVLLIASAAVIYHNTEAGRDMERRVGEELRFKSMSDRGKALVKKAADFIYLKGMDTVRREVADKKEEPVNGERAALNQEDNAKPHERIEETERKKLEKIIENYGL